MQRQVATKDQHVDILLTKYEGLETPGKYVGVLLVDGGDPHMP